MGLIDKYYLSEIDVPKRFPSILVIVGTGNPWKHTFPAILCLRTDTKQQADRHSIRLSSPVVPDVLEEVEGLL